MFVVMDTARMKAVSFFDDSKTPNYLVKEGFKSYLETYDLLRKHFHHLNKKIE